MVKIESLIMAISEIKQRNMDAPNSTPASPANVTCTKGHPDPIVSCVTDLTPHYQRLIRLADSPVISLEEVRKLPHVELTDEKDGLSMYCYTRDFDVEDTNVDPLTRECRGIIFDQDGKLISRAFGYTPMYSAVERDGLCDYQHDAKDYDPVPADIKAFISEHITECKVYPALEGALVRAFCHNGKWYLTTHRKLDAFKSFWGCRTSFGDMFLEALEYQRTYSPEFAEACPSEILLESFFHLLNPKRQYVFLVMNTIENRIVCTPPETPTALHVATFENGVMVEDTVLGMAAQIPYPIYEYQQILDTVNNSWHYMNQGVVVFMPNGKQIKICSSQYLALFRLRGNEASVMFRYLQIRNEHADEYKQLYPEHDFRFTQYENLLCEVSKKILKGYRKRFINLEHVVFPQEEFHVLSDVHEWYKSKRSAGEKLKVSLKDVQAVVNLQTPTALNKMIKRMLKEST